MLEIFKWWKREISKEHNDENMLHQKPEPA